MNLSVAVVLTVAAARRMPVVDGCGPPPQLKQRRDDAIGYGPSLNAHDYIMDGDGNGGDGRACSLTLVPAEPSPGQSMFEATLGFHPYKICNANYFQENIYFCNYLTDTDIPYMVYHRNTTGILHDCPDTKEGCHELMPGLSDLGLESCLEWCGNAPPMGDEC